MISKISLENDQKMSSILVYLLFPLIFLITIWLRKEVFNRILVHVDGIYLPAAYVGIGRRKSIVNWAKKRLPKQWSSHLETLSGGVSDFWNDGSLLCTLINSAIPGACGNPYRHWRKPPAHAQEVAYKYLGIMPIFSDEEFTTYMTPFLERKLLNYLILVYKSIHALEKEKFLFKVVSPKFVVRGMGLYTAEQCKEAEFFIYSKYDNFDFFNLEIKIQGPYSTYCKTNVLDYVVRDRRSTDLYKTHGTFPKSICMKVEMEKDRLRIVYISQFGGIHEINISCNREIILGSPFYVNIINYTTISSSKKSEDAVCRDQIIKSKSDRNSKGSSKESIAFDRTNNEGHNKVGEHENTAEKPVLNKNKPFQISKYLRNLNILNTKQVILNHKTQDSSSILNDELNHYTIYFTEQNYSCFQKFANSCFRTPCNITRASPVFCKNSLAQFYSASPVCSRHIVPEDSRILDSSKTAKTCTGINLPSSEKLKKIDRSHQHYVRTTRKPMVVQEKKLFWETAFQKSVDERKADNQSHQHQIDSTKKCLCNRSSLYNKLKHVDSLYLLRKRPVSKSLNDLHKSGRNKKLHKCKSLDGNLGLCNSVSLENRLKSYMDHVKMLNKELAVGLISSNKVNGIKKTVSIKPDTDRSQCSRKTYQMTANFFKNLEMVNRKFKSLNRIVPLECHGLNMKN